MYYDVLRRNDHWLDSGCHRLMFSTGKAGYSAAAPAELSMLAGPAGRTITPGARRGVIFCHGWGGFGVELVSPSAGYAPLARKLADHGGCVVEMADLGKTVANDDMWGNDVAMARMDSVWAELKDSTKGAAKTDKAIVIGGSMGAITACAWTYRNPTLVKALVLIIPVGDMQYDYNNNIPSAGSTAAMNTAYGGTPDFSTRNPVQVAPSITVPTFIWYASDDPYTTLAQNQALVAAFSNVVGHNMGAVGHTFAAADTNEVLVSVSSYL